MAARFRKNPEVLQREIESGRELVECTTNGDFKGMQRLLDSGASVNAEEYNRSLFYKSLNYLTPLHIAVSRGFTQCVELLLNRGGKE